MAWETRSGRQYYYRSERGDDRRVRKKYFGRGANAFAAAAEDERKRQRDFDVRQQIADELKKTAAAQRLTKDLQSEAMSMSSAILLARGLHRQNYGQWRRRRGGMIAINSREKTNTDMFEKLTDEEARTQIRELAVKAQEGDINAVVEIRRLLRQHPNIYKTIGDLASHAHRAWINAIAGTNVEMRETLIHKCGDLKKQLRAESADTAITRLVIDQVVGTWLQLYHAEMRDAIDSPQSLKWAEFRLKQLESAHRRHLKGIAALATLQRLLPQASRDASGGIGEESNHIELGPSRLIPDVSVTGEESRRFPLFPS